ncbi:MAG: extracellular solute-binding protein [Clostridiaceae bacterium]|nr:extracellular solute-binding protein [Clostridiaceae bacterium]
MKNSKRILSVALALLLVFALAACQSTPTTTGGTTGATTTKGTTATTTAATTTTGTTAPPEPIVISTLHAGDNTPNPDNLVLQEITKLTGYIVEMTYVPGADYNTKLNALIAADDLPDLFSLGTNDALQMRDAGLLTDLTDILPANAPTIMADVGDELFKAPANFDEKIYLVFRGALGYPMNTSIRTDWLANVGLEMPKNLDEFYTVLKAFTEDDPNKSGKKDTFGLAGGIGRNYYASIFGAYGIPVDRNIQLSDGTVTTWMKHPMILDAFEYMQKLYKENLMEPDFATIPAMELFGKLWTGVAGVLIFQCVGTTNNWMPSRYTETPLPTFGFATLAGPGGSGGVPTIYPDYNSGWVVAASCETPVDAVKLAEFFASDAGDELLYLGVEDVMFRWTDKAAGKYERIAPYTDDATHRAAGAFVYHGRFASKNNIEVRLFNELTREGVALAHSQGLPDATIVGAFDENVEYASALGAIIEEAFAQLVVTDGDLAAEHAEFMKQWDEAGGTIWEEAATAMYKAENP